jgi:hypothetical protein
VTDILQEYKAGDQVLAEGKPGRITAIRGQFATIMLAGGTETIKPLDELTPYDAPPLVEEDDDSLRFRCDPDEDGCGDMIDVVLEERLNPGQAAVLKCDNCGLSWSVWNPPLDPIRTDKFEAIWPIIGQ